MNELDGGGWAAWDGGCWMSKQVAETWLILPVRCGHLSNYYLCCLANPQSRAANSGVKSLDLRGALITRLQLCRDATCLAQKETDRTDRRKRARRNHLPTPETGGGSFPTKPRCTREMHTHILPNCHPSSE